MHHKAVVFGELNPLIGQKNNNNNNKKPPQRAPKIDASQSELKGAAAALVELLPS